MNARLMDQELRGTAAQDLRVMLIGNVTSSANFGTG